MIYYNRFKPVKWKSNLQLMMEDKRRIADLEQQVDLLKTKIRSLENELEKAKELR